MALFDQETARTREPNYHKLRTRNFRVRNDGVERGSVTKSQKGKKACVERKVGEFFSGWHMDNGPKETHVVSDNGKRSEKKRTIVFRLHPTQAKIFTKKHENSLDKSEIPCRRHGPCAPKFGEVGFGEKHFQAQEFGQNYVVLSYRSNGKCGRALQKIYRNENSLSIQEHQCT